MGRAGPAPACVPAVRCRDDVGRARRGGVAVPSRSAPPPACGFLGACRIGHRTCGRRERRVRAVPLREIPRFGEPPARWERNAWRPAEWRSCRWRGVAAGPCAVSRPAPRPRINPVIALRVVPVAYADSRECFPARPPAPGAGASGPASAPPGRAFRGCATNCDPAGLEMVTFRGPRRRCGCVPRAVPPGPRSCPAPPRRGRPAPGPGPGEREVSVKAAGVRNRDPPDRPRNPRPAAACCAGVTTAPDRTRGHRTTACGDGTGRRADGVDGVRGGRPDREGVPARRAGRTLGGVRHGSGRDGPGKGRARAAA